MEQINLNKKKERKASDKITLSEGSMVKLNMWLEQLKSWQEVVKFSSSDLINFILTKYPDAIPAHDCKELMRVLFSQNELPKTRKKRVSNKSTVILEAHTVVPEKTSL